MHKITIGMGVLALGMMFAAALMYGTDKQEIVDCNTWAEQATQYKDFYITHWQSEQCLSHHITVNAPVK